MDRLGKLCLEDLQAMVRKPLPHLAIPIKQISESDFKGLWKAIDLQKSGEVTMREFLIFMRRFGGQHQNNSATPRGSKRISSKVEAVASLRADQVARLRAAFAAEKPEMLADAYKRLGLATWTGSVSEWDWPSIVRTHLRISQAHLDDDAIYLAWTMIDESKSGQVPVEKVFLVMRNFEEHSRMNNGQKGSRGSKTSGSPRSRLSEQLDNEGC